MPGRGGSSRNRAPRSRPARAPADSAGLALDLARIGVEKKGGDVVVLDVRSVLPITDFFVIMTGGSRRQVAALAEAVEAEVRRRGAPLLGSDGVESGRWALVDAAGVVVHVFAPEAREFYDLEGLWADAPRVPLPDKEVARSRGS